jgi:transposase
MDVIRVIMGISMENGVEAVLFPNGPFNSENFTQFLHKISRQRNKEPFVFLDNASYHASRITLREFGELRMEPIFNVAYKPEWNPIENLFSILKGQFKKKKLMAMASGQKFSNFTLVREAIDELRDDAIEGCC